MGPRIKHTRRLTPRRLPVALITSAMNTPKRSKTDSESNNDKGTSLSEFSGTTPTYSDLSDCDSDMNKGNGSVLNAEVHAITVTSLKTLVINKIVEMSQMSVELIEEVIVPLVKEIVQEIKRDTEEVVRDVLKESKAARNVQAAREVMDTNPSPSISATLKELWQEGSRQRKHK